MLVSVDLWVVVPDPAGVLGLRETRVKLDLGLVGDLKELGVGEAHLLGAGVADEAVARLLVLRCVNSNEPQELTGIAREPRRLQGSCPFQRVAGRMQW